MRRILARGFLLPDKVPATELTDEAAEFLRSSTSIHKRNQGEEQQAESTSSAEVVSSEMGVTSRDLHHPEQNVQQQGRRPGRPPGSTKRRGFRGVAVNQGHPK